MYKNHKTYMILGHNNTKKVCFVLGHMSGHKLLITRYHMCRRR
ncbi:hypothetical protein DNHGIG_15330 [Collibacillus ludicampi]|uniref:Uncharacterized protein n=1 Tax=Collibacillus ludicampi TaxID=2771369 RepID=A0AAV4LE53_9BACL|nr:hypothetical protein DNHGIG_15330 [Collibacillus ludicampi]